MKNDKWWHLFKFLFKVELYPYQLEVVHAILEKEYKRVVITASTRAGKSYVISMASIVYALLNPSKRIFVIAPTYKQASIIMEYVYQFIMKSSYVFSQTVLTLDKQQLKKGKRMTLDLVTFKNNSTIRVLSAEGKGQRLLGFGGDLIIVDESALVNDKVFNTYIMRMLGDNPNAQLVEISNPINLNHFYEHFNDPTFYKIQIKWRECVKEGRLTKEFVEEQRRNLTEAEFKMLYDAEFVEEINNSLLTFSQISGAINKDVELPEDAWFSCGVDVARFGSDLSVITVVKTDGYSYRVVEIKSFKQNTITSLAGAVQDLNKKYKFQSVVVDDIGLGGGLTDILNENGLPVIPFKAGDKAKDYKRFKNLKTELAWKLRILFAEGRISIPDHPELLKELRKWVLDYTSDGRLHLKDPEDKSPDFADSLLLSTYDGKSFYVGTASVY